MVIKGWIGAANYRAYKNGKKYVNFDGSYALEDIYKTKGKKADWSDENWPPVNVKMEITEIYKTEQTNSQSKLSNLLFGAVQWINDKPVLDGMPYFETKEACMEYASRMGGRRTPPGISVEYTIIRLERAK